jgi:site-specific DNA-methyltransferase (adenine-specific)
MRHLVDYYDAADLFPGVEIKGGVCYFLWDRDNHGECSVTVHRSGAAHGPVDRRLDESDIFVRDARALEILRKVLKKDEQTLMELISGDTPFGLPSNFKGYRKGDKKSGDVKLYLVEGTRVEKWLDPDVIRKNTRDIRKWKVLVPKAYGAGESWPHQILGQTIVAAPPSACTQTYLYIGPLENKVEAQSVQSYVNTRFCRFLVSLRKISQDAMKSVYTWVPQQTWDHVWTDDELYKNYGITKDERAYIESVVREMPA